MNKNCTIYKTTNFIGKKWTLPIILELSKGKTKWKRYSEIKSRMPDITPKVLSTRLKELEKEKLVSKRTDSRSFPVKCEYSLTRVGREYMAIIRQTKKWALKWKYNNKVCRSRDCQTCDI